MTYLPQEQGESVLNTILFSLPSPSKRLRNANIGINLLCLFACLEFTFFPFLDTASEAIFSRVGAVYPDSAKVVVRYPQNNATLDGVKLLWRQTSSVVNQTHPWRDGPSLKLQSGNDWVDTVKLSGLWPSTPYECQCSNCHPAFTHQHVL